MRVVCLGTIGNFDAFSVDPRGLHKEVCMAETLCGICKARTATVIENKTDKLCSRCYYSRYMFRLPKSQSSRRRAGFPVHSSYYYMGIGNCWQSAIAGNRESQGIGNRRQSQWECGNAQGIIVIVGNVRIHRQLAIQGIIGNQGIRGIHRQLGNVGAIGNQGNS